MWYSLRAETDNRRLRMSTYLHRDVGYGIPFQTTEHMMCRGLSSPSAHNINDQDLEQVNFPIKGTS